MAISYEWDVNTVDVYPTDEGQTDVIYNVHWRLNAADTQVDAEGNPYTASVYGTQVLDTSDLSGFIAQEVEEIYPDLVGERQDGMKTITGMGKMEARLVKAIQEQQVLIEQLQAEVALLKGE